MWRNEGKTLVAGVARLPPDDAEGNRDDTMLVNDLQTDGGRTETKRFSDGVNAEELIVGDRIDKRLVSRTFGQLGERIRPSHPNEEPEPKTQLVTITATDTLDDTHSALLAEPETGTIIWATCHSSQSAWSQREEDWKVCDVGTSVSVETVHNLDVAPGDGDVMDEMKYVQEWVDIVIEDTANGYDDYTDERSLASGTKLKLRDADGREALATISLY